MSGRKRVAYFYDEECANYYYGSGHPMKPQRVRMAHELIVNYGLYKKMDIYRPHLLTVDEMRQFHTDDYVNFLQHVTPDNIANFAAEQSQFNFDTDSPIFDGLFQYCQRYSGGSIGGACKLNNKTADICINWAGGMHHAKKAEASGFCYVNDIVLAILELLKYHQRVMYIDIDVHHGDGVEEAFYTTDRVLTCSFHKYGDFFPGTGNISDIGKDKGKGYAVNFPLLDGMNDEAYKPIFETVVSKAVEVYRPSAVVLQCGADSLVGDRLGAFNLSTRGHAACVEFVRNLGLPLLLVGGGGYTVRNVARCWANECAVALGETLDNALPFNDYYEYYGPDFQLHLPASNMLNLNTKTALEKQTTVILENLKSLPPVPSVQYSVKIPAEIDMNAKPEQHPDVRPMDCDRAHDQRELMPADESHKS